MTAIKDALVEAAAFALHLRQYPEFAWSALVTADKDQRRAEARAVLAILDRFIPPAALAALLEGSAIVVDRVGWMNARDAMKSAHQDAARALQIMAAPDVP